MDPSSFHNILISNLSPSKNEKKGIKWNFPAPGAVKTNFGSVCKVKSKCRYEEANRFHSQSGAETSLQILAH